MVCRSPCHYRRSIPQIWAPHLTTLPKVCLAPSTTCSALYVHSCHWHPSCSKAPPPRNCLHQFPIIPLRHPSIPCPVPFLVRTPSSYSWRWVQVLLLRFTSDFPTAHITHLSSPHQRLTSCSLEPAILHIPFPVTPQSQMSHASNLFP